MLLLILDQATKYLILDNFRLHEEIPVTSFFNIVHARNTGSAFGMFKELGNPFFIAVALLAIVVVIVLIIKDENNKWGFSLILGGASGNLADRINHGFVIDFLDIHLSRHHWPAFNIADSALTAGVFFLLFRVVFPPEKNSKQPQS
jgi:signal peptidase II